MPVEERLEDVVTAGKREAEGPIAARVRDCDDLRINDDEGSDTREELVSHFIAPRPLRGPCSGCVGLQILGRKHLLNSVGHVDAVLERIEILERELRARRDDDRGRKDPSARHGHSKLLLLLIRPGRCRDAYIARRIGRKSTELRGNRGRWLAPRPPPRLRLRGFGVDLRCEFFIARNLSLHVRRTGATRGGKEREAGKHPNSDLCSHGRHEGTLKTLSSSMCCSTVTNPSPA